MKLDTLWFLFRLQQIHIIYQTFDILAFQILPNFASSCCICTCKFLISFLLVLFSSNNASHALFCLFRLILSFFWADVGCFGLQYDILLFFFLGPLGAPDPGLLPPCDCVFRLDVEDMHRIYGKETENFVGFRRFWEQTQTNAHTVLAEKNGWTGLELL